MKTRLNKNGYDLNEIDNEARDQEEDTNRDKYKSRRNRHVWNRDKEHKVTEEKKIKIVGEEHNLCFPFLTQILF